VSSFSDLIRSHCASTYADPVTNAVLVGNIFPALVRVREWAAGLVSNSSLVTVDAALLALTDALVAVDTQDVIEAALEAVRLAIYAALPAGGRENVDPTKIGATVITTGVSVAFTALSVTPAAGSWPYAMREFGALRTAIRQEVFSINDSHGTASFTQAL
jgi:hypothetical protein